MGKCLDCNLYIVFPWKTNTNDDSLITVVKNSAPLLSSFFTVVDVLILRVTFLDKGSTETNNILTLTVLLITVLLTSARSFLVVLKVDDS